jgi:phosphoglycerol transferase
MTSPSRARAWGQWLVALTICLATLGVVFRIDAETLQRPFAYRGDTMFYQVITKNITERGWFLDVPLLGTPTSLDMRDVPTSDNNLHLLILRLLALGTTHYPLVLNGFYLLGFVLVFLSAFGVLRHFGVTWWTNVCASLLFAYAPYHLLRGENHLFLSAYWQIPLAVLLALWVSDHGPTASNVGGPPVTRAHRIRLWPSLAICLAISGAGFYYAFFASYFLVVAGLVTWSRDGAWRRMAVALGLIGVIAAGLAANFAPSLIRFRDQGAVMAFQRPASDADTYGLRIAQLLLPTRWHVLDPLAELRSAYSRRPAVNENDDVSLGLIGSTGFLGLLWWFIVRRPSASTPTEGGDVGLLNRLSVLSIAGVLLATMGGFGSMISVLGFSQIRAYNRIGVFLSFLALFAVALWVDRLAKRFAASTLRTLAFRLSIAIATVLALFDQISPGALPDYQAIRTQFANDQAFVRDIEAQVPRGAMIFQLPFMPFPEAAQPQVMRDYDLLRGHLHSTHLRWSYGTVRGREGNSWLRQTTALPSGQLVDTLAWAGFSGVYIDRHGFADGADALRLGLESALGASPLYSADRELVFYSLTRHRARLESATPRADWDDKRDAALHPPLVVWREGFYGEETDQDTSWRWARSRARLALVNRSPRSQGVSLRMLVTPNVGGSTVVRSALLPEPIRVQRHDPLVERRLLLPPGRHEVYFESDAPRLSPPNDFREVVFEVRDLRLQRVAGADNGLRVAQTPDVGTALAQP